MLTPWQAVPPVNTCSKETAESGAKPCGIFLQHLGNCNCWHSIFMTSAYLPVQTTVNTYDTTHQIFSPATSKALTSKLVWLRGAGSHKANRSHLLRIRTHRVFHSKAIMMGQGQSSVLRALQGRVKALPAANVCFQGNPPRARPPQVKPEGFRAAVHGKPARKAGQAEENRARVIRSRRRGCFRGAKSPPAAWGCGSGRLRPGPNSPDPASPRGNARS